jgi:hypothetical protein
LEKRIAALRGQVRRLLALYGSSWVVAGALLAILVAGLADWLFRLGPEVRLGLLLAVIGLTGWLVARFVVAPLVVRFRDLDIALRIERRWPGLQDRLATTVQYLEIGQSADGDREDLRGSRQLREETVRRTLAEVEGIDFREVVDARPARRSVATAAVPLALGLALLVAAPGMCRLALERLFVPFGPAQWPKQTHLAILEPERDGQKVARGEPFRLEVGVAEGEALPAVGEVTYYFEDGEVATRRLGTQLGDSAEGGRPRFFDRIAEAKQSFRYEVRAGDDRTDLRTVRVVPPPRLETAEVRLAPPPYTREDAQVVEPPSGTALAGSSFEVRRVVTGTEVTVTARANKPIAEASLSLLGAAPWEEPPAPGKPGAGDDEREFRPPAVDLRDGGRTLVAHFPARASGAFEFVLRDTEGFRGQPRDAVRFDLDAIKDAPPQVTLLEPPGNRDVTPNAVVPLAIEAADDFGLEKVWIEYSVAFDDSAPEPRDPLVLWVADDDPDAKPGRAAQVRHAWDLADPALDLKLRPGAVVTFHAAAIDLDGVSGPKVGKSRELQLRVLDPERIAEELEDRRREIREEIARTLAMQDGAITPVQDARRTLRRVESLPPRQRDEVRNAEAIQRQVTGRINDPAEGLHRKVERYLEDQQNLKVENPEARDQMRDLLAGLDRLRDDHLVPAERGLSQANKTLDENAPRPGDQDTPKSPGEATSPQPKASSVKDLRRNEPSDETNPRPSDETNSGADETNPKPSGETDPGGDETKPGGQNETNPTPPNPKGSNELGEPKVAPEDEPTPAGRELARAEEDQQAIADELKRMLDDLGEFETYRGMIQEAKSLLKEQQDANEATDQAAEEGKLEGKSPDQLTEEQKAQLDNLAARQRKVAEGLSEFQEKLDEMAGKTRGQDPLAAQAMSDAAKESRKRQTAGKASETAQQLAQNQTGKAREAQKQLKRDLETLLDSLQNRRENDLKHLIAALDRAQKDLRDLQRQQAMNRLKTEEAKGQPDAEARKEELQKLAKEQKQIEEELRRQLAKLEKLRVDTRRSGSQAAQKMSKAGQNQQDDNADEAMDDQEEAMVRLQDLDEEIEDQKQEMKEQLALEQLNRIRDDLANLSKRQDGLVAEAEDYGARQEGPGLTLPEKKSVVGLGRAEDSVTDETKDLVERLDAAPVYAEVLERAADAMKSAADRLRKADAGDPTRRDMKLAARRFSQLIEALKADPSDGQGEGEGRSGGQGGGGDGIPTAAQLKVLKMLQEEINDRTDEIADLRERNKGLDPDQEDELARLQSQQRRVADLARDLTQPKRDDGEE